MHLLESGLLEETLDLIERDYGSTADTNSVESNNVQELTSSNTSDNSPMSPTSKLRKRLLMQTQLAREVTKSKIRKEMERYESFSIPPKSVNILVWWKQHQNILPLLSIAARSVLAIPASSAKSERVYSSGANIVTAKRTRMKPNKVEQTLIIRENKSMVDEFKKNTTYKIVETRENAFLNVDIIEILREATEDSDTDAGVFDIDDKK